MKNFFFKANLLVPILFLSLSCINNSITEKIVCPIWYPYTLDFEGPELSEKDNTNPFTDISLTVTFQKGDRKISIPGFFAADGNASETSAEKGKIWRVHFTPDELGDWTYEVVFIQGKDAVLTKQGKPLDLDGAGGSFTVIKNQNSNSSFYKHGRVRPNGTQLQHTDGTYFLKGGADSPENLLAFVDFDGTYSMDSTKQFMKTFEPHLQDWKTGNPTWKNGKGKGLIGALNYLASKGMNSVYFLTMNIQGDGRDVWPYLDPSTFDRFDCSKLDQWDKVFTHAQSLGIMLHFVTQETENELLLDNGDSGRLRKLYYRELIARFAHHPGTTWNLGEENGPANFSPEGQTERQQRDMAKAFKELDPYDNYLALHTHSFDEARDPILEPLLSFKSIDGLSMQINLPHDVYNQITKWSRKSKEGGHQWVLSMDEIGEWHTGVKSDKGSPDHDTIRTEVLWPSLMAGGAGVEWYFGYRTDHNDLNGQDWRSRDIMWDQTRYAIEFFQKEIPFWDMKPTDGFLISENGHCLAKENESYLIYLKKGGDLNLDLGEKTRTFEMTYFDPFTGNYLDGEKERKGTGKVSWTNPKVRKDLVILLQEKR